MSEFMVRNYHPSDKDAVRELFQAISGTYPNCVFWWPGEEAWMWNYAYCVFHKGHLIGKGQVRPINVVSETNHPNAKHTIFVNIKTHPDWEDNGEVHHLMFSRLLEQARYIQSTLPPVRGTKLCVGNDVTEVANTRHYLQQGFTPFSHLFWMERLLDADLPRVCMKNPAVNITQWAMETDDDERTYLDVEQAVFREQADGIDRLREYKHKPYWVAIGAFHQGEIVGHAMAWQEEDSTGMIESVFVTPPWRGQGIAKCLLSEGLAYLKSRGLSKAELLVVTENTTALNLYTSLGFELVHEEQRYWIDL